LATPDERVYLSPPHVLGGELDFVADAIRTNWIAPLGPHVDAFESEVAGLLGVESAVALSSGTAAIHLALVHLGVSRGDDVLISSLTFAGSVNPVVYVGATPVFVDSEARSWNIDPDLIADELDRRARRGALPKAVIVVHLYGQAADLQPIVRACEAYEIPLIEDAAEALGTTYRQRPAGAFGRCGILSFNGNKIITTSGGGMLVSNDRQLIEHARKLSTQARDPAPHYEHSEIGFNYRLSNVLAALGRAQLATLQKRIEARQANFAFYADTLGELPGVTFMPEAPWGIHTRWLTTLTIDPDAFGADREEVRVELEASNIEARPVWKPMHLQPVFDGAPYVGGGVAEDLFNRGLCLPSGSNLTPADRDRVVALVRRTCRNVSAR
jgi:dTDP-4-amino-4,6-dideoxygalactose transaminase